MHQKAKEIYEETVKQLKCGRNVPKVAHSHEGYMMIDKYQLQWNNTFSEWIGTEFQKQRAITSIYWEEIFGSFEKWLCSKF